MNVPPVTLPFWVPCTHLYFYIFLNWLTVRLKNKTGVVEEENGRETLGWNGLPSRALSPLYIGI